MSVCCSFDSAFLVVRVMNERTDRTDPNFSIRKNSRASAVHRNARIDSGGVVRTKNRQHFSARETFSLMVIYGESVATMDPGISLLLRLRCGSRLPEIVVI